MAKQPTHWNSDKKEGISEKKLERVVSIVMKVLLGITLIGLSALMLADYLIK